MYKDKDRQREANRQAKARQRAKGMTATADNVIPQVIPERTEEVIWESEPGASKKINEIINGKPKTFADLPPDVQATIRSLSHSNEEMKRRTAIALAYQQMFPDNTNRGIE